MRLFLHQSLEQTLHCTVHVPHVYEVVYVPSVEQGRFQTDRGRAGIGRPSDPSVGPGWLYQSETRAPSFIVVWGSVSKPPAFSRCGRLGRHRRSLNLFLAAHRALEELGPRQDGSGNPRPGAAQVFLGVSLGVGHFRKGAYGARGERR